MKFPRLLLAATSVLAVAHGAQAQALAQTERADLRFTLGWLFHAAQAPYVHAASKGYFKAGGLNVLIDPSIGSGMAILRVAQGTHDIGMADMRETLLVGGQIDAIAGFITSGSLAVEALGGKRDNISVMKYSDHNVDGYGSVIFAKRDFVEGNAKAVAGFTRAVNHAYRDAVADPVGVTAALRSRDPLVNMELENRRMMVAIKTMYITPHVKASGISSVEPAKLERAIAVTLEAFNLKTLLKPEQVYTDKFLPPRAERMLPEFKE